jgi:hypothetical protein
MSRDNRINIMATDWTTGVRSKAMILVVVTPYSPIVGPTPFLKWLPGPVSPEREADHSPPSSADIKNAQSYASTPPYVFMALCSGTGTNLVSTFFI